MKKAHNMKMHIVIGIAVLIIFYYLNLTYKWVVISHEIIWQLVIIGIIYSNMADIDQPGSIINKWATVGLGVVIVYSFINPLYKMYGIIAAIVLVLLRLIEHRTIIHSALGGIIISAPLYYISPIHAVVGFIAFLSHIISDNDFSFGWEKDHRL